MIDKFDVDFIIKDLCDVFKIKVTDLISKKRIPSIVTCRQVFYYITAFLEGKQIRIKDISGALNKDYTIVIKQRRLIKNYIEVRDEKFLDALKTYELNSFVYKKVKEYYQSKNKVMDYGEAFKSSHYTRSIK